MFEPAFTVKDEASPDARRASARTRRRRGAAVAFAMAGVMMATPFAYARPAPDSFADLAEKVTPAVVNVSTTQKVSRDQQEQRQSPFPPGSPFDDFLKRFFDQQGMKGGKRFFDQQGKQDDEGQDGGGPAKMTALGSGFIIDASGYVVTNNHVVGEAEKVDVTLADGRKFDAKIIGRDDKTDLALLKITADKPLPFVAFGDSDKARVGDWVMAVGNPFGLGGSVTAGIVSARSRDIHAGPYDDFLQIDAAINRGNSGGPTFNTDGQVIGVNTAIYSPNGGSIGIGFAIPASIAKPVIAELRDHGRVDRGWLGVQIQEVTPEIASGLGLDNARGALVSGVNPNGPAAKAGVKQGDVILSVGDHKIDRLKDLPRLVAEQKAGEKVRLGLWRDGGTREAQATIGSMPKEQVAQAEEGSSAEPTKTGPLGLALAPLTPETRQRFGLDAEAKGVVVTAVQPDSPAAETGLRAGDVVLSVNQAATTTPTQVSEQVAKARKDGRSSVLLLIARRGTQQFVAMPIGKA